MSESAVKGEVFVKVLDQVESRWGTQGLGAIGYSPGEYSEEQWYPFADMCALLDAVKTKLGNNNPTAIYQLGFGTVKSDPQWQETFRNASPSEVFLTAGAQEGQYRVGVMTTSAMEPKHVRIDLACDMSTPLWLEFYRGRLQGVLELTGRTGVVHLLPASPGAAMRTYDIKWG